MKTGLHMRGRIPAFIGMEVTDETREKIRKAHLGKKRAPFSKEHRTRLSKSATGRKMSPESIEKTRLSNVGRKATKETKNKMSIAQRGHSRSGWKLSDETKKKISLALKRKNCEIKREGKIRKGLKGENNPRWIKDRTKLKVGRSKAYDTKYKYWMREVKMRDGWKCKINNHDCSGRLEAHHILNWVEHPELRYEINNGITLCHTHHPRKRVDEEKLSPYYKELLLTSK